MPISAEDKIYKKIAPTRDTHANWTLHNPVLPEGVIGAVKDRLWSGSLEFVMGDGISTYTELPKSAVEPSDNIPLPDADIGSAGAETNYARGGHIHPRGPRSKAYVNAESDEAILADTKAGDIIIRKVNNILEILARGDDALSSLLKSVLLDSEGKVPADRLRIVGVCTAGAIIESGENAKGRYIKWADGTQECFSIVTVNVQNNPVISGTWVYPAAFISSPAVTIMPTGLIGGYALYPYHAGKGTNSATIACQTESYKPVSGSVDISVRAIGRWK